MPESGEVEEQRWIRTRGGGPDDILPDVELCRYLGEIIRQGDIFAKGSRIAARVYLRRFGSLLEEKYLSPHDLLKIGRTVLSKNRRPDEMKR